MTEPSLSDGIGVYLQTPKQDVGAILDKLFSNDAVVHDEGRTYIGLDAIERWNNTVASAFTFTRQIIESLVIGSGAVVRVRLEGDFPGSPVDLHHHFTMDGDKIGIMTICP